MDRTIGVDCTYRHVIKCQQISFYSRANNCAESAKSVQHSAYCSAVFSYIYTQSVNHVMV